MRFTHHAAVFSRTREQRSPVRMSIMVGLLVECRRVAGARNRPHELDRLRALMVAFVLIAFGVAIALITRMRATSPSCQRYSGARCLMIPSTISRTNGTRQKTPRRNRTKHAEVGFVPYGAEITRAPVRRSVAPGLLCVNHGD